jgi:hypothetical protein
MAHLFNNSQENHKNNNKYKIENPNYDIPTCFDHMSKTEKKIFILLFKFVRKYKKVEFSTEYIMKSVECSRFTVQEFKRKWSNKLFSVEKRINQTDLWFIPNIVMYYFINLGGVKFLENWSINKFKVLKEQLEDINSDRLMNNYKQVINKKEEKIKPPPPPKSSPNSYDFKYMLEDEVLCKGSDSNVIFENEEILLKFGLNNQQIVKVYRDQSRIGIKNAIADASWYERLGNKINHPFSFIYSRATEHTLKQLQK